MITGGSGGITGFRYDKVASSRDYNTNSYSSGATNPFGSFNTDAEQTSLYATYTPAGQQGSAPANTALPTISGSPKVGQTLTASTGSWTESPTGYAYQWQRCDSTGAGCNPIEGAKAAEYAIQSADLGSRSTAFCACSTASPGLLAYTRARAQPACAAARVGVARATSA